MIKILDSNGTLLRLEHPVSEEDGLDPELFVQFKDGSGSEDHTYEEFCYNEIKGKHLERGLLTPLQSNQNSFEVNIGTIIPRWVKLDYSNKLDQAYEFDEDEYVDGTKEEYLVCAEDDVWNNELRRTVKGRKWKVTNDVMEVPTEFPEEGKEAKWSKELTKDYHLVRIDRPWGKNPLYDELYREQLREEKIDEEVKRANSKATLERFLPK